MPNTATDFRGTNATNGGTFELWNELPTSIQHEVVGAVLKSATTNDQWWAGNGQAQQRGGAVQPGSSSSHVRTKVSEEDVHAVRAACRVLRDSMDAATKGVTASLRLEPKSLQLPSCSSLRLHRFPRLSCVRINILPFRPNDPVHTVHLEDLPPALEQLFVDSSHLPTSLRLPTLSHLISLEITTTAPVMDLDLSLFPALQRCVIRNCQRATSTDLHLLNLSACTQLQHLGIQGCTFRHELDPRMLPLLQLTA